MIHEIFDFFPFNMSSGPAFLAFYSFFTIAIMVLAVRVRRAVGARLDRAFIPSLEPTPMSPSAGANPYRAQGFAPPIVRKRLTSGWIPAPDEFLTIAYMKEGERGVVNTLISTAMAVGWLSCLKEKAETALFYGGTPPQDRGLAEFHARLTAYHKPELTLVEVRIAAGSTATFLGPAIARDLDETGMVRSAATVRTLSLISWLAGALILGIGIIRFLRALELDRPAGLLIFEMLFIAFAVVILAQTTSSRSELRDEYLTWLDDSTISLRADIASGRRRDPADVALAVAVGGISALAAAAPFAAIYRAMVPAPIVIASSSDSGSSSGGSSCGGGGGSSCGGGGGSSCGGGGGCGG